MIDFWLRDSEVRLHINQVQVSNIFRMKRVAETCEFSYTKGKFHLKCGTILNFHQMPHCYITKCMFYS